MSESQDPIPAFRVLLIGNYPRDGQESMRRFAASMFDGLKARSIDVELIFPEAAFGRLARSTLSGPGKWLAYLDKYLLFPLRLRRRIREISQADPNRVLIVHICDHSNAVYAASVGDRPLVITCHDLLAVRGALGEDTDCPASFAGRLLQKWILRGLGGATVLACVSEATQADAERLVRWRRHGRTVRILLDLNYPYCVLPDSNVESLLRALPTLTSPFVLHVGSNLRRKNREGVLRIFGIATGDWSAQLVFAGQPLSSELRELAASLGLADRIIEVNKPSNELLTALYNRAFALLFPSRFEGFGWPIIEAQACGCPVLCTNSSSLPEVAGHAAFIRDIEDEQGLAADLLSLRDPSILLQRRSASLNNARRFIPGRTLAEYIELYETLLRSP